MGQQMTYFDGPPRGRAARKPLSDGRIQVYDAAIGQQKVCGGDELLANRGDLEMGLRSGQASVLRVGRPRRDLQLNAPTDRDRRRRLADAGPSTFLDRIAPEAPAHAARQVIQSSSM
jgi:hypothetical protein